MNKEIEVSKLKSLIKAKGFTVKEFAKQIDMSFQGWHQAYNNKDMKLSTFYKISSVLDYQATDLVQLLNPNNDISAEGWLIEINPTSTKSDNLNPTDVLYHLFQMPPGEWLKVKQIVDSTMSK